MTWRSIEIMKIHSCLTSKKDLFRPLLRFSLIRHTDSMSGIDMETSNQQGLAYKQTLGRAANASTIAYWKGKMLELKELNEVAWKWLDDKPVLDQWSKSRFSEHPKFEMLMNKHFLFLF